MDDRTKTAQAWAEISPDRTLWNHPYTEPFIDKRVGAEAGSDWVQKLRSDYLGGRTFPLALSLGCGLGAADRDLYKGNLFHELIGLDISPGAVEKANAAALEATMPANYYVADLNHGIPQHVPGKFDLVYSIACLHHIADLEGLYASIADRLADDGYLMFLEYCGPSRLQWREKVLRIANDILAIMPPELKGDVAKIVRPAIDVFRNHDPSESIRSGDVVDLAHLFFDVVAVKEVGFTLTHVMLSPILRFFDDSNPTHTAIVRLIFLMDELLIDNGVIEADTKIVIARRKV